MLSAIWRYRNDASGIYRFIGKGWTECIFFLSYVDREPGGSGRIVSGNNAHGNGTPQGHQQCGQSEKLFDCGKSGDS